MAQIVLSVPGITCGHCERVITNALAREAGVNDVRVDIPARKVQVTFDEFAVDVDQMKAILEAEEYPVEAVEPAAQPRSPHIPTIVKDPVCGMDVDPRTTRNTSQYRGQTYYFCAPSCKNAFEISPGNFLKPLQEASICSCCSTSLQD